jgi:hypothetical protein
MTTGTRTSLSKLQRKILQGRGIGKLTPGTKQPVLTEDMPDEYLKTPKMKYFESRFKCRIEKIIFKGSLSDAVRYFRDEVDRATVSRWRKHIRQYLGIVEVTE